MNISVEEILADGSKFRYTVIVGTSPTIEDGSKMVAAELIEYKAKGSQEYMTVLPKAMQMTNEEKALMRGTFQEAVVNKKVSMYLKYP